MYIIFMMVNRKVSHLTIFKTNTAHINILLPISYYNIMLSCFFLLFHMTYLYRFYKLLSDYQVISNMFCTFTLKFTIFICFPNNDIYV